MHPFTMLSDVDLAEYETPFETPDQLAAFILDADNDSEGYTLLRRHMLDFTHSLLRQFTNWDAIYRQIDQYPELPRRSLMKHGLCALFRAAADRLNGAHDGLL